MSNTPFLSIVVPSLQGQTDRLRLLLARQTFQNWELIVKQGIRPAAKARNLGAAETKGEFIVFMDDDAQIKDDTLLSRLVAALGRVDEKSAVGIRHRISPQATPFQKAQAGETITESGDSGTREIAEVGWNTVGTLCLAIRRKTFLELQGFDEHLISGEDYEFSYRVKKNGGKIFTLPGLWIEHDPPPTLWKTIKKTVWYETGNAQVALKHPDAKYRIHLRGPGHAALYLILRTLFLPLLCFIKVSYLNRKPKLNWRPLSAFVSYIGAWAYSLSWIANARSGFISLNVIASPVRGGAMTYETTTKKIFYLITGLHVGGAEKLLFDTARCLDRKKFTPVVATLIGGKLIPDFEKAGIRVYNIGMRHKLDVGAFFRLKNILEEESPDIIHTHLFHADILGRILGSLCRVPLKITTIHCHEPWRNHWFPKTLDRLLSKLNDGLIAVSEKVKRSVAEAEKLDPDKIEVIPNAIRSDGDAWLQRKEHRAKIRKDLGLSEDELLLCTLSRLYEPFKGIPVLLKAIKQLSEHLPQVRCVLIGDGPHRKNIEALADTLELKNHVIFAGEQLDPRAWLCAMDVFTQPSLVEGSPLSVIEAMAAGLPIVATSVGGIPELIRDGKDGLLVPPNDPEKLCDALRTLLTDRSLAERLGSSARSRFQENFDMERVITKTEAFYERLLLGKLDRKIRLLEMATTMDSGGVTTYLSGLLAELPKDKFQITVASGPEGLDRTALENFKLPFYIIPDLAKPISPLKDVRALFQLIKFFKKHRFDIVHTHMSKCDAIAGLAARLCGIPCLISTAHGPTILTQAPSKIQACFDFIERIAYRYLFDKIICVSESTRQSLIKKGAATARKLITVSNGIKVEQRSDSGRQNFEIRSHLSVAPDQPLIGMVGRLSNQKSSETLIDAIRQLRGRWPNLICLIIGDGPKSKFISDLVEASGLQNQVILLGRRKDAAALIGACDIFVLSTHYEGMSISVLEAMEMGQPVIASNIDGMSELVSHGQTGLLVPPNHSGVLAEAIEELLKDTDLRRTMGRKGKERVLNMFRLEQQTQKTAGILIQSFLKRRRPAFDLTKAQEPLSRFLHYVNEEGFSEAATNMLKRFTGLFYRSAGLWFLSRSLAESMVHLKSRTSCSIRRAGPLDTDRVYEAGFQARESVRQLLCSKHHACFIATKEGKVIALQWVALGPGSLRILPLEKSIRLSEGQAYLYGCRALRAYRSQAVIPAVEFEVFNWLRENSFHTLSTDIRSGNAPSLKTFEKLGFEKTELVNYARILKYTRIRYQRFYGPEDFPARVLYVAHAKDMSWVNHWKECSEISAQTNALLIDLFQVVDKNRLFFKTAVRTLLSAADLIREIRTKKYAVVHCQGLEAIILGSMARKFCNTARFIAQLNRDDKFPPFIFKKICSSFDSVIFPDETLRQIYIEKGFTEEDRAAVLPKSQASWASYNGSVSQNDARTALGLPQEKLVVGTILPLRDVKSADRFLSACRRLAERIPDCEFVLSGKGPLSAVLKKRIEELDLKEKLKLLKQDGDYKAVLKAMDVFIRLSDVPKHGLLSFEAMASAKHVLRAEQHEPFSESEIELLYRPDQLRKKGDLIRENVKENFDLHYEGLQTLAEWQDFLLSSLVETPSEKWSHGDGCSIA